MVKNVNYLSKKQVYFYHVLLMKIFFKTNTVTYYVQFKINYSFVNYPLFFKKPSLLRFLKKILF